MMHLNLEWKILDRDHVALVFDKAAWTTLQTTADARGLDTHDMIVEAVVNVLGLIVTKRTQDRAHGSMVLRQSHRFSFIAPPKWKGSSLR